MQNGKIECSLWTAVLYRIRNLRQEKVLARNRRECRSSRPPLIGERLCRCDVSWMGEKSCGRNVHLFDGGAAEGKDRGR